MGHSQGEPVRGVVHATSLTTAVEVPFYRAGVATSGGATAYTLLATERLVITDIYFITGTAGDIHVFLSDDNDATAETGETVLRGTVADNGGVAKSFLGVPLTGAPGASCRVSASNSATVDVVFSGYIIKV